MQDYIEYIIAKPGSSKSIVEFYSMYQIHDWFINLIDEIKRETPAADVDWNKAVLYTAFPGNEKKKIKISIHDKSTDENWAIYFIICRKIKLVNWNPNEELEAEIERLTKRIQTETDTFVKAEMLKTVNILNNRLK